MILKTAIAVMFSCLCYAQQPTIRQTLQGFQASGTAKTVWIGYTTALQVGMSKAEVLAELADEYEVTKREAPFDYYEVSASGRPVATLTFSKEAKLLSVSKELGRLTVGARDTARTFNQLYYALKTLERSDRGYTVLRVWISEVNAMGRNTEEAERRFRYISLDTGEKIIEITLDEAIGSEALPIVTVKESLGVDLSLVFPRDSQPNSDFCRDVHK